MNEDCGTNELRTSNKLQVEYIVSDLRYYWVNKEIYHKKLKWDHST